MRSLNDGFNGGRSRSIQLKNPERFVRPDETAGGAPAEAAGVTEPLGFRQIGLFGRDLGGGFLAVASEGQDDQEMARRMPPAMVAAASMNCQMEYSLIHARSLASSA